VFPCFPSVFHSVFVTFALNFDDNQTD
jgi:hypothetical protein